VKLEFDFEFDSAGFEGVEDVDGLTEGFGACGGGE